MKTPCLLLATTTSVFCSLGLSCFLGLVKRSPPSAETDTKAEPALFLVLLKKKLQENSVWDPLCLVQLVNQQQSLCAAAWRAGAAWWEVWRAPALGLVWTQAGQPRCCPRPCAVPGTLSCTAVGSSPRHRERCPGGSRGGCGLQGGVWAPAL